MALLETRGMLSLDAPVLDTPALDTPVLDAPRLEAIALRASFVDLVADPFYQAEATAVRYLRDGLMVIEQGRIVALGPYEELRTRYGHLPLTDYSGYLILPGLIDLHLHLPQTEMIAAYGEQLLAWLEQYTFPTEQKFCDLDYAQRVAQVFVAELLRHGTTTALVLAAVYPASVEALFAEAARYNLRLIGGKVMMDRHAPRALLDSAESSYRDSKALIERWHGQGRLAYAITPRFAATSTPAQLEAAHQLWQEFPDTYLHTHLSENLAEIAWVRQLFPEATDYLDIYDRFGLVTHRSIFAHGIHLSDREFDRLSEAGSAIAFCPTSNLFLGSGLFNLERAKSRERPIPVGLATDVGAGTSFSLWQTANEAYKVAQLRQQKLSPFQALFLATLGSAEALSLSRHIGNFDLGKEADLIVVDPRATPLMAFRNPPEPPEDLQDLGDRLFSLIILGDDRAIHATYVMGQLVHQKVLT
jgi:guanine deaminase